MPDLRLYITFMDWKLLLLFSDCTNDARAAQTSLSLHLDNKEPLEPVPTQLLSVISLRGILQDWHNLKQMGMHIAPSVQRSPMPLEPLTTYRSPSLFGDIRDSGDGSS